MSITFDNTALFTAGERDAPGSPASRAFMETMPGASGEYAQTFGRGGRDITASGILRATGNTAALAHTAFNAAVRTKQELGIGSEVEDYVSADGTTYGSCMLVSYVIAGPISAYHNGTNYTVEAVCAARLRQLDPDDIG